MKKNRLLFCLKLFSTITAGNYSNYNYDSNPVINPPIIVATICGDLSGVKNSCTATNINTQNNEGQTALMHSCIHGSGDIFTFLMENNADFKIKDNFGKTALDYAIEHNRVEMIEFLALSSCLDVDQALKDPQDEQKIINKIIKTQKFITWINDSCYNYYPDLDELRSYIAGNVDVNAVDVNDKNHPGWTALMLAITYTKTECIRTEMVKLLIAAGADINFKDYKGDTALMKATAMGLIDIVKLLLAAGADVNIKGNDGKTALMQAAKKDHTEIVKLLLSAGANFNANLDLFINALSKAAINGDTEMVKLLIATGADVNAKDNNGKTRTAQLIKDAAKNGHIEIVKLLINAGADINAKDGYGDTVLLYSTRSYYFITQREKYRELSKLFIESGADVNAENYGCTALNCATYYGEIEIVKLLLAAGVDVDAKDNDGKTALMLAKDYNYPEIVKLLKQHANKKIVKKTATNKQNNRAKLTNKAKIILSKKIRRK